MSTEHSTTHRSLEARARALLEASVADIDGATRGRLAAARVRALESVARPTKWRRIGWLLPAGAVAAATLAAWLGGARVQPLESPAGEQVAVAALGDLELLLDMDMLDEPEFYDWLAEQPELRADGTG